MSPETAKSLIPYFDLIRAYAEGKVIEILYGGAWCKTTYPRWADPVENYRIRPEPPPVEYVPLEAADVPPGSVVRHKDDQPTIEWWAITQVFSAGFYIGDAIWSFEDAKITGFEIKRPGEDWQPCRKVKPK